MLKILTTTSRLFRTWSLFGAMTVFLIVMGWPGLSLGGIDQASSITAGMGIKSSSKMASRIPVQIQIQDTYDLATLQRFCALWNFEYNRISRRGSSNGMAADCLYSQTMTTVRPSFVQQEGRPSLRILIRTLSAHSLRLDLWTPQGRHRAYNMNYWGVQGEFLSLIINLIQEHYQPRQGSEWVSFGGARSRESVLLSDAIDSISAMWEFIFDTAGTLDIQDEDLSDRDRWNLSQFALSLEKSKQSPKLGSWKSLFDVAESKVEKFKKYTTQLDSSFWARFVRSRDRLLEGATLFANPKMQAKKVAYQQSSSNVNADLSMELKQQEDQSFDFYRRMLIGFSQLLFGGSKESGLDADPQKKRFLIAASQANHWNQEAKWAEPVNMDADVLQWIQAMGPQVEIQGKTESSNLQWMMRVTLFKDFLLLRKDSIAISSPDSYETSGEGHELHMSVRFRNFGIGYQRQRDYFDSNSEVQDVQKVTSSHWVNFSSSFLDRQKIYMFYRWTKDFTMNVGVQKNQSQELPTSVSHMNWNEDLYFTQFSWVWKK